MIDFKNLTFLPQHNQNVTSFLLQCSCTCSTLSSAKPVNQNKTKSQTFCEKVKLTKIFNWLQRSFNKTNQKKIVVPNQFSSLLLYMDKCGRVLAKQVKILLVGWLRVQFMKNPWTYHVVYTNCCFVLTFKTIYVHNMFRAWNFRNLMSNLLSYYGLANATFHWLSNSIAFSTNYPTN